MGIGALMLAAAREDPDAGWIIATVVVVGVLIGFVAVSNSRKQKRDAERAALQRQIAELGRRLADRTAQEAREHQAQETHTKLNDLMARKIDMEAKVLEAQLATARHDASVREMTSEYQRLVVAKTELEIRSLKLHIREQEKRNEDYSGYDDE